MTVVVPVLVPVLVTDEVTVDVSVCVVTVVVTDDVPDVVAVEVNVDVTVELGEVRMPSTNSPPCSASSASTKRRAEALHADCELGSSRNPPLLHENVLGV